MKENITNTLIITFIAFLLSSSLLEAARDKSIDLTELSLEELMEYKVTSTAKKPQKISESASAIFVITEDDIRRSGVTSIPEALRMVPGIHVAHMDANKWAITSRGFNGVFANKLLVLIDGRSVYTPLFSGVYWDIQDTLLEDIERIEVIRGPGATLWGANAVNGVINIITKNAGDTQGGLVSAGGGSEERGFGSIRYGAQFGDNNAIRFYGKYFNRDDFVDSSNNDTSDEWDALRGGFRSDWELTQNDFLTLQGDIYDGESGQKVTITSLGPPYNREVDDDIDVSGGNVLTRWEHRFSENSNMMLQGYYDRTERDQEINEEVRDTFDLDFQHNFSLTDRQEIIWGLGYRFTQDDIHNTFTRTFTPDTRDDKLYSAFVQDDISIIHDRLSVILGSKFEHNDYTSVEIQPNARLLWTPSDNHSIWSSVSRAARTPARGDEDARINFIVFPGSFIPPRFFTPTTVISGFGNKSVDSEKLMAYELGWRAQMTEQLYFDVAAFFNDYEDLMTIEMGEPFFESSLSPPHLVLPVVTDNKMDGHTYGVELVLNWEPLNWWSFKAAYTYLQIQLHLDSTSNDFQHLSEQLEGRSPHNQLSLRSSMNVTENIEFDLWTRYVENLPDVDVESYVTFDVRLGWKPIEELELALVGQNLLEGHHPEFNSIRSEFETTEVERGVYGKISWKF